MFLVMLFSSFGLSIISFLLPIIIAKLRNHKNFISITLFNVFFGITGIGYLIAIIWAFSSNIDESKPKKFSDGSLLGITILLVLFTFLFCFSVMFSDFKYQTVFVV